MAAKYGSLQQNQWTSYQLEDTAYNFGAGQTNAVVQSIGGIYRATLPTYADGDAAMAHFTSAGRLMVDTELSLDGNIIVNNLGGAAAHAAVIAGNPLQMGMEAADFDGSALPISATMAEGDVTYPKATLYGIPYSMPVNEDGSLTTIYGEDSAHVSGHGGTFILAVRNDAGVSLAGTDGDYTPLSVNSSGALQVNVSAGTVAKTVATAALAINTTTALAAQFRLVSVTCHFSAAPTTSENFVVKLDATDGVAYDTVLFSVDPSATAATDIVYIPDKELLFVANDQIVVTFTNTDTRTYGLRIVTQPV